MKKLIIYCLLGLASLSSCSKDENQAIFNTNGTYTAPVVISPVSNSNIVITADNKDNKIIFKWNKADYTLNLGVTYTLTADSAGTKSFTLGSTTSDSLVMTYGDLNDKMLNANLAANASILLSIKVTSALDNQQNSLVSEIIKVNVTTYKYVAPAPKPATLYIAGGFQVSGGDPSKDDAIQLYTVTGSDSSKYYEEYITIPINTWIKFCTSANWGGTNYGDSGTANILTTDGNAPGISISAGYYKVSVNIVTLAYSFTPVTTWGMIGTATAGQWSTSTPMTYDATNMVWKATNVHLTQGALKFRANDGWDLNYGPVNSDQLNGQLIGTDAAISIPQDGTYDVIIDLSKSKAPYTQYTYKVVKK